MNPQSAAKTLEQFFLEARCKILDVAAILDRLDRGEGTVAEEQRLARIRQALEILLQPKEGRAERVQQAFSLPYDPNWKRPAPKTV